MRSRLTHAEAAALLARSGRHEEAWSAALTAMSWQRGRLDEVLPSNLHTLRHIADEGGFDAVRAAVDFSIQNLDTLSGR